MKLMMLHRYLDVVSIQSVRGGRVGVYICHCYLFVIPLLLLMIFVTCIRVSVRNETTTTQDDE